MPRYTKLMHEMHLNRQYAERYKEGYWDFICENMEGGYFEFRSVKTAWKRHRLGSFLRTHFRDKFNQSYLTQDLREVANG